MIEPDEKFYEIAAEEVAAKNISPGIMAKCLVEADGDEKKAIAYYIRRRVEQLKKEEELRLKQLKNEQKSDYWKKRDLLWSSCKNCGFEGTMRHTFRASTEHQLFATAVKCPKCGHLFDWYHAEGSREASA